MLKALFLDMDETLCDTRAANQTAKNLFSDSVKKQFGESLDGSKIAHDYVLGIYREWSEDQEARYLPLAQQSEGRFRVQLIRDILSEHGVEQVTQEQAEKLQEDFDEYRIQAFDFYPGIPEFLEEARKHFTLVVITNGPEFSQIPKVRRVDLASHVDHIIIGGQEPHEKPHPSIFYKAMQLAGCEAHEAIHVGDSLAADIAGAHNSGITSVWIKHQQPLDGELGIDPQHTLLHPSEIPEFILSMK